MPTAFIAAVLVVLGLAVGSAMAGAAKISADEPIAPEDIVQQNDAKDRKTETRPQGSSHGSYSGE